MEEEVYKVPAKVMVLSHVESGETQDVVRRLNDESKNILQDHGVVYFFDPGGYCNKLYTNGVEIKCEGVEMRGKIEIQRHKKPEHQIHEWLDEYPDVVQLFLMNRLYQGIYIAPESDIKQEYLTQLKERYLLLLNQNPMDALVRFVAKTSHVLAANELERINDPALRAMMGKNYNVNVSLSEEIIKNHLIDHPTEAEFFFTTQPYRKQITHNPALIRALIKAWPYYFQSNALLATLISDVPGIFTRWSLRSALKKASGETSSPFTNWLRNIGLAIRHRFSPKAKDKIVLPSQDSESERNEEDTDTHSRSSRSRSYEDIHAKLSSHAPPSAEECFKSAREAFESGDYKKAIREVSHMIFYIETNYPPEKREDSVSKIILLVTDLFQKVRVSFSDKLMFQILFQLAEEGREKNQLLKCTSAFLAKSSPFREERGDISVLDYPYQVHIYEQQYLAIISKKQKLSAAEKAKIIALRKNCLEAVKQGKDNPVVQALVQKSHLLDAKKLMIIFKEDPMMLLAEKDIANPRKAPRYLMKGIPVGAVVEYLVTHPHRAIFFLKDKTLQRQLLNTDNLVSMSLLLEKGTAQIRHAIRVSGLAEKLDSGLKNILDTAIDGEVDKLLEQPELAKEMFEDDYFFEELAKRPDLIEDIEDVERNPVVAKIYTQAKPKEYKL